MGLPTGTTRFLYDGDALVGEYNASGTQLARYGHGALAGMALRQAQGDRPLVSYASSAITTATARFLYADPRGSIVLAVNSSGTATATNTYDEYGIPGSANAGRFQYTGQAWLPELGMYYYKARMYSPTLGRFMQTDPIGYEDQYNLYAYVGDDPVNSVDPSGLRGGSSGNTCSRLGSTGCSGTYAGSADTFQSGRGPVRYNPPAPSPAQLPSQASNSFVKTSMASRSANASSRSSPSQRGASSGAQLAAAGGSVAGAAGGRLSANATGSLPNAARSAGKLAGAVGTFATGYSSYYSRTNNGASSTAAVVGAGAEAAASAGIVGVTTEVGANLGALEGGIGAVPGAALGALIGSGIDYLSGTSSAAGM